MFDETCTHVDVPTRTTCDPVVDAYRRTLGLGVLVVDLRTQFDTLALPDAARVLVGNALDAARADLARSSNTWTATDLIDRLVTGGRATN